MAQSNTEKIKTTSFVNKLINGTSDTGTQETTIDKFFQRNGNQKPSGRTINFNKDPDHLQEQRLAKKDTPKSKPLLKTKSEPVKTEVIDQTIKMVRESPKEPIASKKRVNVRPKNNMGDTNIIDDQGDENTDITDNANTADDQGDENTDIIDTADGMDIETGNKDLVDNETEKDIKSTINGKAIVLKETHKPHTPQPEQPKNIKIPPHIDFGIDKIINKDVLGMISGNDDDSDDQRGRKMYQNYKGTPSEQEHTDEGTEDDENQEKDNESIDLPLNRRTKFKLPMRSKYMSDQNEDDQNEDDQNENDQNEDDQNEDDQNEDDQNEDDGQDDEHDSEQDNQHEDDVGEQDQSDNSGHSSDEQNDESGTENGKHKNTRNSRHHGHGDDDSTENKSFTSTNNSVIDQEEEDDETRMIREKIMRQKRHSKLSRFELNVLKRKELTLLERHEAKGYKPHKKFTMVDKLDDIITERERLDDDKGCAESIKWQRKILMGTSSGIEYLNKVYDPFELKLEGWSESIYENIDDYDDVFEELYHKYKHKVKVAPEIKLIGMFAGSALMFHFSKTLFTKASDQVPGFDDVMRNNPDLKTAYEQAALHQMNMNSNQSNSPLSSIIGNFVGNPMLGNVVGGLFNKQPNTHKTSAPTTPIHTTAPTTPFPMPSKNTIIPKSHQSAPPPDTNKNIDIGAPTGVEDLLNSLTKGTNADLTELQLSDVDTNGSLTDIGSNVKSVSYHNKRTTRDTGRRGKINVKI
jgi:hypothetical protein